MRRMVVALLLALSGVVLTQLPAHACSCVVNDTRGDIRNATTVLAGTVTAKTPAANTLTYEVRVDRVFKGTAAETVTLRTAAQPAACGLDNLAVDRRYVVFGTQQGAVVEVNSCGGTAPMASPVTTTVKKVLGAGKAPTPLPDPAPITATITRVDQTEPASFQRLAAPGGALVIVGLLGLLFLRRLGRAR